LRESCKRERVSSGGGAKERERSTPWPWRSTTWLLGSSSCGEREFVVERDQAAPRRERERVAVESCTHGEKKHFFGGLWLPVTPTKIFWARKTMIPRSSFQIFIVSRAGLIICADRLK
jgi:hypothetical protein